MNERNPETWQARYETARTGWDRGESSPALRKWLEDGSLKQCRILVPGCGNGHEVVELALRDFDVTAVDFAKAPIDNLKARLVAANVEAKVTQEDFFTFQAEPYDVVYEQTCLCAIQPSDRERYEQQLARCVRSGGQLFALFMQSGEMETGPPFPCPMDQMKRLFDSSRWQWGTGQFEVAHPAGLTEIAVVLQRKESQLNEHRN